MSDPFAATLRAVDEAMRGARDPWWVIGSAAVRLHGAQTSVADVDVMTSARDAAMLCAAWGRVPGVSSGDGRFRSAVFERFEHPAVPVEVMGGMRLLTDGVWRPVSLDAPIPSGGPVSVPVPGRDALIALLRRFGRPKDLVRAALLEG